jgi:hypothetical protein
MGNVRAKQENLLLDRQLTFREKLERAEEAETVSLHLHANRNRILFETKERRETSMKSLGRIIEENGSDKGRHCHNYVAVYECLFRHLRHRPIALLELGVGQGYSIRAWLEYFECARVVGVDLYLAMSAATLSASEDRLQLYEGKAQDPNLVPRQPFDIIISDADHTLEAQIETLRAQWGNLTDEGLYIIEDLFVGKLPWGGRAHKRTFCLRLPYRGYYGSPSFKFLPHQAQDIAFLNRRDLPADICQILDKNDYFFPISNVSPDGGLHMMMVIYKRSWQNEP